MVKEYNKKIVEIFGNQKAAGEVGIEVEIEGNNLPHVNIDPFWAYHEDHSLRGPENAEYVLRHPIERGRVPEALSKLFKALKKAGSKIREDSPNTSVHVHLNMQQLSLKKVYTVACVWYILEQSLMDWCGSDRAGNLFCLRASDAEASLQRLASAVRYGRYNELNDQDGLRYSAINYTALGKFGSLEFRGLGGVYDEDVINQWVTMLLSIKDFAVRYDNPTEVITEFSARGPEEFLRMVLPDGLHRIIYNKDTSKQLRDGMRLIQNVAYCVSWEKDGEKKSGSRTGPVDDAFVVPVDQIDIEVQPRMAPVGNGWNPGRPRIRDMIQNDMGRGAVWDVQDGQNVDENPMPANFHVTRGDQVPNDWVDHRELWVRDAEGVLHGHDVRRNPIRHVGGNWIWD